MAQSKEELRAYQREYQREWRLRNPEKAKAKNDRWYEANKDKIRNEPFKIDLARAIKLKSYYKKLGDFDGMAEQQAIIDAIRAEHPRKASGSIARLTSEERLANRQATIRKVRYRKMNITGIDSYKAPEKCETCGQSSKKMCMDHDHTTHKFRGWLCDDCNIAIGRAQESVGILFSMITYLSKHKGVAKIS